jgi:hypothetical protein
MAIELKKFQAEFKTLDAAVVAAFGEWKLVGDTQGGFKKLLDGARVTIGDRIAELKTQGATGTKLDDFAADAEVKAGLATVKAALTNYANFEKRKVTALQTFKDLNNKLLDLADRMDAEIASRKKKLFEPKSLPDMIKVAKSVRDSVSEQGGLKAQSIADIVSTVRVKPGDFEKTFWADMEREVTKSAAVRANASVTDLLQMFNPRVAKLRSDKVQSLAVECEKLCKAVAAAGTNAKLAKQASDAAVAKAGEMHEIVEKYSAAYEKNKSFLAGNADHDKFFKIVSDMTSLENRTLKLVQAAQKSAG